MSLYPRSSVLLLASLSKSANSLLHSSGGIYLSGDLLVDNIPCELPIIPDVLSRVAIGIEGIQTRLPSEIGGIEDR